MTSAPQPSVGRDVHYVSHGTPIRKDGSQEFRSECRAAKITEVGQNDIVGLCVFNPTGLFFRQDVHHQENEQAVGSWHWPERVGS